MTGQEINLAMKGLLTLENFVRMATAAESKRSIIQALTYKINHAKAIAQEYIKNGLRQNMYL